ncbi:MAG: ABC transporter permease [Candidatus Limnocylindrales bacterium]
MQSLLPLTIANVRSFMRDRAALFWTIAFPVIFILLFGLIFSGRGGTYAVGWADEDHSAASAQLRVAFGSGIFKLEDADQQASLDKMRSGKLDAVIVVPAGYGAALDQAATGPAGSAAADPAVKVTVFVDPSSQTASATISTAVQQTVGAVNQALTGRPPVVGVDQRTIQTGDLNGAAFFVPSILAMALMQLGIFSAIPLVEQREKLILKRLSATPLPRWVLVGSNIGLRLIIAAAQTVIILALGVLVFGVKVLGDPLLIIGFIALGALAFTALGYVIASFAPTEESANFITSAVQFPMMFLSGIFFPVQVLPDFLKTVAAFLPLTYLGDALRQTMVGGVPLAPLPVDFLVLSGWLVVCLVIAARYFRWT